MTIEYLTSLPEEYRTAALELYLGALNDIFNPILGQDGRAQNALGDTIDPKKCLAALNEGKLVGILGMGTKDGGFLNPTFAPMIASYGLLGGMYRSGGLAALHHPTKPNELYVDGIAVSENLRSCGIGSRLFTLLAEVAKKNGYQTITLEVVNTNTKAQALYDRLGFTAIKHQKIWPFSLLFKFKFQSTTFMIKSIQ